MSHPFDLNPADLETIELEFVEELTDEQAEQVDGSGSGMRKCGTPTATTKAIGEEGGWCGTPVPKPPEATTLALGEEGGDVYTTLALGEEGGFWGKDWPF
jgi:hypothetical protein